MPALLGTMPAYAGIVDEVQLSQPAVKRSQNRMRLVGKTAPRGAVKDAHICGERIVGGLKRCGRVEADENRRHGAYERGHRKSLMLAQSDDARPERHDKSFGNVASEVDTLVSWGCSERLDGDGAREVDHGRRRFWPNLGQRHSAQRRADGVVVEEELVGEPIRDCLTCAATAGAFAEPKSPCRCGHLRTEHATGNIAHGGHRRQGAQIRMTKHHQFIVVGAQKLRLWFCEHGSAEIQKTLIARLEVERLNVCQVRHDQPQRFRTGIRVLPRPVSSRHVSSPFPGAGSGALLPPPRAR